MRILGLEITRSRDPDAIVPVTSNLNNYVYLDAGLGEDLKIFKNVQNFIAKEFTKINLNVDTNIPNADKINYLLNLQPNSQITANTLLFNFATGMLKHGRVYYKVVKTPKSYDSFDIKYLKEGYMKGYKEFKAPYLKMKEPTNLLSKYSDLISSLSTSHSSSVIEIASDISTRDDSTPVEDQMEKRLTTAGNQIQKHGMFFTQRNETAKDHANVTQPDGTALEDLKNLIYENFNISGKLLDGTYTETNYKAFWATQLQPLASTLEELLDIAFVPYENFVKGEKIKALMNLMQFATLDSLQNMATHALYYGFMTANEVRENFGLDPYELDYGNVIYSNANAVSVNYAMFGKNARTIDFTKKNDGSKPAVSPDELDSIMQSISDGKMTVNAAREKLGLCKLEEL